MTYLAGGEDEREGVSNDPGSDSLSDMTALLPQPHHCKVEAYISAIFQEISDQDRCGMEGGRDVNGRRFCANRDRVKK